MNIFKREFALFMILCSTNIFAMNGDTSQLEQVGNAVNALQAAAHSNAAPESSVVQNALLVIQNALLAAYDPVSEFIQGHLLALSCAAGTCCCLSLLNRWLATLDDTTNGFSMIARSKKKK